MMGQEYINFSHDYVKLDFDSFTTIRRRKKWKKGAIIKVLKKRRLHSHVLVRDVKPIRLIDVSDDILKKDTLIKGIDPNTWTREWALNLINSFYQQPISEDEQIYLYELVKIEEVDLSQYEKIDDGPGFVAPMDLDDIVLTGEAAERFLKILEEREKSE